MHFSNPHFHTVILAAQDLCSFSIRKDSQYGDEIGAIRFTSRSSLGKRRLMRLSLFKRRGYSQSAVFCNRNIPLESFPSEWTWGSETILPSVKNVVLEDDRGCAACALGKIGKGAVKIVCTEDWDMMVVFAVAVASFLCKIH
jgi:hypothetical protein